MPTIPEPMTLGPVGIGVADLDHVATFWTATLGLRALEEGPGRLLLGAGGRPLIELLRAEPGRRDPAASGLFHVALLLPDRRSLGRALAHLLARGVPLTGASDHHVSEALYLDDPEGNGIEIYADRPRETWYPGGRFRLVTEPLDHQDLLAGAGDDAAGPALPEGTVVGHVHLETHDLPASRAWYTATLGFEVMTEGPSAAFLSRDGYHHHLGLNRWGRRSRPLDPERDRLGIRYWTIMPARGGDAGAELAVDPAGIRLRLPA